MTKNAIMALSRIIGVAVAVAVLTGCDITDPYLRNGTWRPNGANDANLRAMVVSPSDLVRGVSSAASNGQQAAAALDRARNDKVRALPESAVAKIIPVSSGTAPQGSQ